jgi:hypothetical protein
MNHCFKHCIPTAQASIVYRSRDFCRLQSVKTGSGTSPVSYSMVIGGLFSPGLERPEREADHSPPSSAEVKDEWSCISLPWCAQHVCLGRAMAQAVSRRPGPRSIPGQSMWDLW